MKKVLIIAYFFPPYPTIGSQRPYKLAKYLPKFGWKPIILTAKHPGRAADGNGTIIIETDYKDILGSVKSKFGFDPKKGLHEQLNIEVSKNFNHPTWKSKLIKLLMETIAYPDNEKGWYSYALKSASEFLSKEKIDVIISTSFPVTSHLVAKQLKNRFKIPWIADLRDLWTQNHFYHKFKLIKHFERRLELKTLSNADALLTVTPRFADDLKSLHKNKRVVCITNGYDTDDFKDISAKLTNKFTITYTGILYGGKRDPSLLFKALLSLINENKINRDLIEVRFYCRKEEWLIDDIKNYNLKGVVKHYDFIPRESVIEKQKESQILLLLLDNNDLEKDVYPAKVFEYLGARRPIIAYGGSGGAVSDLLKTTNAGRFAENENILKNILLEYYREFIEFGEVRYCSNPVINSYTYYSITQQYAEVLNNLSCS